MSKEKKKKKREGARGTLSLNISSPTTTTTTLTPYSHPPSPLTIPAPPLSLSHATPTPFFLHLFFSPLLAAPYHILPHNCIATKASCSTKYHLLDKNKMGDGSGSGVSCLRGCGGILSGTALYQHTCMPPNRLCHDIAHAALFFLDSNHLCVLF